jgi:hypothetical protein
VLPPRPLRIPIAAAWLAVGVLFATTPSARAQGGAPTKATPQVRYSTPQATYSAPQAAYSAPQATYAVPQAHPSGQYASPQGYQPCACYFPQGYCPFPSGNCAFPRGNCLGVQPSAQWPVGSSQFGTGQAAAQFTPEMIGD